MTNKTHFSAPMQDSLYLNILAEYFYEIVEGSKTIEYRDKTDYYDNKLFKRPYKFLKLRNGYNKVAPEMIVELKEIKDAGDCYELHLGNIIYLKNVNCNLLECSDERWDAMYALNNTPQ